MSKENHHLWLNQKVWWLVFTPYDAKERLPRIRRSLRTQDVIEARRLRDELLAAATVYPLWKRKSKHHHQQE